MVVLMPIGFTPVPDWFSFDNQGAAVASADVSGNGRPDLVVLMIDNAPDQNSGLYRVGADVDATGAVTGGWGPWQPVPDWFSFENQGAGLAVADVTGNGKLDVVVLLVDNPPVQNQALYRVGADLDATGAVTGGWGPWQPVPDWLSWENQGAGIAVADVTGNGKPDVVVLLVDNPVGPNQGLYRIGRDLDATGAVTGGWGPWQPVPDWFSWENQGAGIAVADVTGNGQSADAEPGALPDRPRCRPRRRHPRVGNLARRTQLVLLGESVRWHRRRCPRWGVSVARSHGRQPARPERRLRHRGPADQRPTSGRILGVVEVRLPGARHPCRAAAHRESDVLLGLRQQPGAGAQPGLRQHGQGHLDQRAVGPRGARTWLLPEPEKNITFPVRSSAAWMASTWESNFNNSQDPSRRGSLVSRTAVT